MESSYFVVPLLAYVVISVFATRPFFHSYVRGAWRLELETRKRLVSSRGDDLFFLH